MDIEPPHGPVETWRDFFVHLVIITLGLLIALALEGIVGYIHERHLVHEANANITSEMHDNQKEVEDSVKAARAISKGHEASDRPDGADEIRQGFEGIGQHHI